MTSALSRLAGSMLVILLVGVLIGPSQAPPSAGFDTVQGAAPTDDPDRLYADREHVASAERAAAIWEERLAADSASFESAWKLSRICYWLGGHVAPDARRRQYERGALEMGTISHFFLAETLLDMNRRAVGQRGPRVQAESAGSAGTSAVSSTDGRYSRSRCRIAR